MSETVQISKLEYIERTVDVVAAYVSNNSIPTAELATLIAGADSGALDAIATKARADRPEAAVDVVERYRSGALTARTISGTAPGGDD